MQRTEHQEDLSDLDREQLQPLPGAVDVPRRPHGQRHETEVEQVEADHEQPVDRIGQAVIPVEHVEQEGPAAARQGPADADREPDADQQVDEVGEDDAHDPSRGGSGVFLNTFKNARARAQSPYGGHVILNTFNKTAAAHMPRVRRGRPRGGGGGGRGGGGGGGAGGGGG